MRSFLRIFLFKVPKESIYKIILMHRFHGERDLKVKFEVYENSRHRYSSEFRGKHLLKLTALIYHPDFSLC